MISLMLIPEMGMECSKGHQWDEAGYLHVADDFTQRFLPDDRECPRCGGIGAVCFYEEPL